MNIIIVGKSCGKRKIRWVSFLTLGLVISLIVGLGSGGVFFLLCGRWSHGAVIYGVIMGMGLVATGLYKGLTTPLERLHELPSKQKT